MKRTMLLAILGVVGLGFAALAFRVDAFGRSRPRPQKAPAIIVLGARIDESGRATPALQRRVEKAAALYQQGVAPMVIFSGGGFPSEAGVARTLALNLGVPADACVLEEQSRNTRENAQLTARLLRARKISAAVLVSDGYHLLRARLWFASEGLEVQAVASDRELSGADRVLQAVRETLALSRSPFLLVR